MQNVKSIRIFHLESTNSIKIIIVLQLCTTFLLAVPTSIHSTSATIRVPATPSNGTNYWSPYGPRTDNLLYTVYSDFSTMFTAFSSGQLDITDWPVRATDLSSGFVNNPDFFVTPTQSQFDIFTLDINHHTPLINSPSSIDTWQIARGTLTTPFLALLATGPCSPACPTNTFQLTILLQNLEEGSAAILDGNNQVTATITGTSSAVVSKADDGGSASPTGSYSLGFLSDALGITSYTIATTIYSGAPTLPTSGAGSCATNTACVFALRVNYNSGSTMKPSGSGIAMGRALSHLLNKNIFLTGPYLTPSGPFPTQGKCVDVFAPPAQGLMKNGAGSCDPNSSVPNSVLTSECTDSNIGALLTTSGLPCSPSSLYVLKSNVVSGASSCAAGTVGISCFPSQSASPPTGYASNVDLAAACIYFVEAGFTTTGTGTIVAQCQQVAAGTAHIVNPNGSCNTTTAAGCIVMYIRTDPPRKAFGTIIADELNYLLGTPAPTGGTVCYGGPPLPCTTGLSPTTFTISALSNIIFAGPTPAFWNLYTGGADGFNIHSTSDDLYDIFSSQFASTSCNPTAAHSSFPTNYGLYCSPEFDTQATAGESGIGYPAFAQAAILLSTKGGTLPIYSGESTFAALNAWNWQQVSFGTGSSLVSIKGKGFGAGSGLWSNLNMRPVPGYVPASSNFYASGCNPSTGCVQNQVRRSIAQQTVQMSPYTFISSWEEELLRQIYDSMLAVDPNSGGFCQSQPGGLAHCIDWMTLSHSFTSNTPAQGQTTSIWRLRNDIFFSDGIPVTAHDVCFTILSYRDAPSARFFSHVSNVVSCTAVGSMAAQVVVNGMGPFSELNLGELMIVPEHVWAPICGGLVSGTDSCSTPSALSNPSFDPVAAGDMVGSGPFVCNPSVGISTIPGHASCTQNADGSAGGQALAVGGRAVLKRFLGYMRCCSDIQTPTKMPTTNLQALEWADPFKYGDVNIVDVAEAVSNFGAYNPLFAHPTYSSMPSTQTVDIGDVATIASYFGHGLTTPFLGVLAGLLTSMPPPGLTQMDPKMDPYDLVGTPIGTTGLSYYLGMTEASCSATTCSVKLYFDGASSSASITESDASTGASISVSVVNTQQGTRTTVSSTILVSAAAHGIKATVNTLGGPMTTSATWLIVPLPFPPLPPPPLSADFTSAKNGLAATFTATISPGTAPYSLSWDFDDGTTTTYNAFYYVSSTTHPYTAGGTGTPVGTNLSVDPAIKFVNSPPAGSPNAPGVWTSGHTVIYDNNVGTRFNGIYISNTDNFHKADVVISGTAPPNATNLSIDSNIKFVDTPPAAMPNAVGVWGPDKPVIYDGDGDGVYNAAGTPPDYAIVGKYTVKLTVTDDMGVIVSITHTILLP